MNTVNVDSLESNSSHPQLQNIKIEQSTITTQTPVPDQHYPPDGIPFLQAITCSLFLNADDAILLYYVPLETNQQDAIDTERTTYSQSTKPSTLQTPKRQTPENQKLETPIGTISV